MATRKGAWIFHGDARRKAWVADGPHFLGHTISHVQLDPRDGRTLLAAAKTGHLGPTIFRSTNLG
ncbi:MAG: glycosyl hydrolase, partial [Vitreoscilla sp.]|nr:glycosyl hydrolase [Vitreoscilla sp.]